MTSRGSLFPGRAIETRLGFGMLIDLHTHTRWGSGCAYMEPSALVQRAKHIGLDGVCITEHNRPWDRRTIERLGKEHDFLVLSGIEVTSSLGHILVFGLHRSVINVWEAGELKEIVGEADGVMVAAHPFRGQIGPASSLFSHSPLTVETASQRPLFQMVDAIEVYNGRSGSGEQEFARAVSEHLNLKGAGGSDAHNVASVGWCATIFENRITCEEELIAEIRAGRFTGANGFSQELLRYSF